MYTLSDQQIDFILDDIRRNGIELEDLQYNLLDHVCCIIEHELEASGDFESFYRLTIQRFYKQRLAELEEETQTLLIFKHYYTMKKLMIGSGMLSAALLSCGILFKFNYWPGASALIAGGILSLSFIFLPLFFLLRIQEKKETKEKVLVGLTSLVCIGISLSILFKVMHWQGANVLGLGSLFVLVLLFLPVYFITGIRNPDTKVNTIVSSVLIIAGSGLFLTLVSSPKSIQIRQDNISANLVRSEMILQSEMRMFKLMKANDTIAANGLANEITTLCEQIKSEILMKETGFPALTGDHACKSGSIRDELVLGYFEGTGSLSTQQQLLETKITAYNQQINPASQHPIPQEAIVVNRTQTIPGYINNLIQTEMFVLQNERILLAAR